MLWLYERGLEDLRIETSFDNVTNEYVLIVKPSLGQEQTERFPDSDAFGRRIAELERKLADERWTPSGSPIILPDGWKVG
jgi:hypothetical protein